MPRKLQPECSGGLRLRVLAVERLAICRTNTRSASSSDSTCGSFTPASQSLSHIGTYRPIPLFSRTLLDLAVSDKQNAGITLALATGAGRRLNLNCPIIRGQGHGSRGVHRTRDVGRDHFFQQEIASMPFTKPVSLLACCLALSTLLAGAVVGSSRCLSAEPAEIVFESGIEYANPDDEHLQVNLARPQEGEGPFPAVLCIHGGGFRAGKREGYDGLCKKLAARGYVAVTASYRLAPKHPFPAAVHDVKAAVRWLRANAARYHIDPERIGVTGGSAGGHLAQFLGVTEGVQQFEGTGGNAGVSSAVRCVVNVYGPSDFTKSYGKSVDAAQVLPLFLGGDLEQARHRHILASPLYWVTPQAAPTLCIHGTEDKAVYSRHGR